MQSTHVLRQRSLAIFGIMLVGATGAFAIPARADSASTPAPPPTAIHQTVTGVATVESVDQKTRQVLLTDPSGQRLTITAGSAVHNLAQVHAGDKVQITYQRAVAVQLAPLGSTLPAPTGEAAEARAARGQLPAGAAYMWVRVTVRVNAVDTANNTVTFTGPNGATHTALLRNPAMQNFASQLKPGDNVQIDYLQGVTINVQKMQP